MNRDPLLLRDILDAIARIQDYTAAGEARFFADPRTQDAVLRNLEVIGEATPRTAPWIARLWRNPISRIEILAARLLRDEDVPARVTDARVTIPRAPR